MVTTHHIDSAQQRQEAILAHLPLVKTIVWCLAQHTPPAVELGDLIQAGTLGLIEAVDRFDAARGVSFETYASIRIRGAIYDELRRGDWAPRSLRVRSRSLERATADLQGKLGRSPTTHEISDRLHLDPRITSRLLGDIAATDLCPLPDDPGDSHADAPFLTNSDAACVRSAIECLPGQQRAVIAGTCFARLTNTRVGQALNVSRSRVSQVKTQAVRHLRRVLARQAYGVLEAVS